MSQRRRRPTPRAAAYLRVSNEAEGNPELVRQREAIEAEYAHQQGYLLVGEYLDACPGISQQRPGLTRMMSDARMGDFESAAGHRYHAAVPGPVSGEHVPPLAGQGLGCGGGVPDFSGGSERAMSESQQHAPQGGGLRPGLQRGADRGLEPGGPGAPDPGVCRAQRLQRGPGVPRRDLGQQGPAAGAGADADGRPRGAVPVHHRDPHLAPLPQRGAGPEVQGPAAEQAGHRGGVRQPAGDRPWRPERVHDGGHQRAVRRVLPASAADVDEPGQTHAGAAGDVERLAALRVPDRPGQRAAGAASEERRRAEDGLRGVCDRAGTRMPRSRTC